MKAFEMAHQLRRDGQEVSLLALIDSDAPGPGDQENEEDETDTLIGMFSADLSLRKSTSRSSAPTSVKASTLPPDVEIKQARRFLGGYQREHGGEAQI